MAIKVHDGPSGNAPSELLSVDLPRRSFLGLAGTVGGTAAVGGLLAACGSSSSGSGNSASDPFVLGEVHALTGPAATTFEHYYLPVSMALAKINASGGIGNAKVKTIVKDDQADPSQEPTVFRQLAQSNVHFVIGPNDSTTGLAAVPIATSAKMIQLNICVADQLNDPAKYPYSYLIGPTNTPLMQSMVDYCVQRGWKKIVLLHEDSAFGTDAVAPATARATQQGAKLISVQHPTSTTDMAPYVGQVQKINPDAVLLMQEVLATEVAMFNAFENIHYNPPKIGSEGTADNSVMTASPAAQMSTLLFAYWKNFSYAAGSSPTSIPAKSLDYVKQVQAKLGNFGGLTVAGLAYGIYDFPFMLQRAVKMAGSRDPDKVRHALDSMPAYDGVIGSIKFSSTNHSGLGASDFVICRAASASAAQSLGGYIVERA